RGNAVLIWNASNARLLQRLTGHGSVVCSLDFSPDGRVLASGSMDKTIRLWDALNGRLMQTLRGHRGMIMSLAFHPEGNLLVSGAGSWDKLLPMPPEIKVWDTRTAGEVRSFEGHGVYVSGVTFSPSGLQIAAACIDSGVWIWETETGRL